MPVPNSLRIATLASVVLSLALLIPGVTQPVVTLTGTMDKSDLVDLGIDLAAGENASAGRRQMITALSSMLGLDEIDGELQAYAVTRSIWSAVVELARNDNLFVAVLIVMFSIVVPSIKLLLQLAYVAISAERIRSGLQRFVGLIIKWSMADVFVMSLLIVFLAGQAKGELGDLLLMESQLEVGFYWFLAYCIFSIASSQLFGLFSDRPSATAGSA